MPDYWMDSDSLMRPKDTAYQFDIVPQFWTYLEDKANEGVVASSIFVFEEIKNAYDTDPLRIWAEAREGLPLFHEPNAAVQAAYQEVADYVNATYKPQWAAKFLKGADGWLVAHSKVEGGTIVTFEELRGPECKEAKIPNVCRALGVVDPVNTWEMLKALGARFG